MLNLMYITNNPDVAKIAENAGVDRIFVDMEYMGKDERQKGLDSVKNHHTVADCIRVRKAIEKAELMVRINPMHDASKEEIDAVINAGADVVMLPYFKSAAEVSNFIELVDGRAKTFPLLETPEAVACLPDILSLEGIDEMHIGLNDLSLGMKKKFMFELLADGTVDNIADKIRGKDIPFGFGGIASLGHGDVPSEYIIGEHYRLGSSIVILSRSFCRIDSFNPDMDMERIRNTFNVGVENIRAFEGDISYWNQNRFEINRNEFLERVDRVIKR